MVSGPFSIDPRSDCLFAGCLGPPAIPGGWRYVPECRLSCINETTGLKQDIERIGTDEQGLAICWESSNSINLQPMLECERNRQAACDNLAAHLNASASGFCGCRVESAGMGCMDGSPEKTSSRSKLVKEE